MNDMLYNVDGTLIAVTLLVSMLVAMEAGYRIGLRRQASRSDDLVSHVNAFQSTILGILALLIGFTFSLSLQRFDVRSASVVEEANTIGTAYLRSTLLPRKLQDEARGLLREYVDLRTRWGELSSVLEEDRVPLMARSLAVQQELWALASRAAEENPAWTSSGMFIQSINEIIDSFGKRNALLERHVPEVVLLLLYVTFLMTGCVIGFTSGFSRHRPSMVSYVMVILIVVLVFIILDLDRPRRGFIQVSQSSMVELRASMHAQPQAPVR